MDATTIGIDLAKNVFQIHAADVTGKTAKAIADTANKAAALNERYLDRNVLRGTSLDMGFSLIT